MSDPRTDPRTWHIESDKEGFFIVDDDDEEVCEVNHFHSVRFSSWKSAHAALNEMARDYEPPDPPDR